jgi:pSer/pThr/pTyr-binding forkhead associated (FHA) protein
MLNCPYKDCFSEIEDDSLFCDQCGKELLVCPQDGELLKTNFCSKHGKKPDKRSVYLNSQTANIQPPSPIPNSPPVQQPSPVSQGINQQPSSPGTTVLTGNIPNALTLILSGLINNITLNISDGDIIGRVKGNHAAALGKFSSISGTHAKIEKQTDGWKITDVGSMNGTKVNNVKLQMNVSVNLNSDDIISFADQEFKVIIK